MSHDLMPNLTPARLPVPTGRGLQFNSIDDLFRLARCVVQSGLAPKGMNEQAVLISMQLGMELGLTPLASLQSIAVINGHPGLYGDAALALVRGSGLCESYEQSIEGEGEHRAAVVSSKRVGQRLLLTRFSMADARRAGLASKEIWKQYPDRMLLFRARGVNLRDNFGDVLRGLRTAEELQDIPADAPAARPLDPPPPPPSEEGAAALEAWRANDLADKMAAQVDGLATEMDVAEFLAEVELDAKLLGPERVARLQQLTHARRAELDKHERRRP